MVENLQSSSTTRITTAWLTILSGTVAFVSYFLVAGGVNFNFEVFSDPISIFDTEGVNRDMLKWSMITDIFGYYILLLPLLFYLHGWLQTKSEWANVISFSGLAYILLGSAGAAILAIIWPMHLQQFSQASSQNQETIKLLFESITAMVYSGLWNLLNAFFGGVWFLFIGVFLKQTNRLIGWLTTLLGIVSLLDWLGNTLEWKLIAESALNIYLILAPLWAIVIGIAMLKKREL